jgi:hypothetical protein
MWMEESENIQGVRMYSDLNWLITGSNGVLRERADESVGYTEGRSLWESISLSRNLHNKGEKGLNWLL